MDRDQKIGALLLAASVAGIIVYGWLLTTAFGVLVVMITAFVAVAGILAIIGWIGWTMATTPPPKEIEQTLSAEAETEPTETAEEKKE